MTDPAGAEFASCFPPQHLERRHAPCRDRYTCLTSLTAIMVSKLADELLKEILSPPLLVPDELFADSGAVSPFSKATYSAADVLLVCKRWLRVATPALYATVVVRSLAQAQALAFALKRNPDFGRYIKKLRLEGAFGQHLAVLATTAPNITDLCFSLALYADSHVNGLVKLLSAVSPERVILTTAPVKIIKNKGHAEVVKTLCSSIPQWSKLVCHVVHTWHGHHTHITS